MSSPPPSPLAGLRRVRVGTVNEPKLHAVRSALRAGEAAREVVVAIDVSPYKPEGQQASALVAPKKPFHGALAALIIPVGGGHHFAEHHHTGTVLTLGILLSFFGSTVWPSLLVATVLMVLADAALTPAAVRRRNADETAPVTAQLMLGGLIVGISVLAALMLPR